MIFHLDNFSRNTNEINEMHSNKKKLSVVCLPKTVYLATLHDESALHRGQPKNPERIITKMVSSSTTAQNMFNIWILYRLADSISNCPDLITIIYKLLTARLHPAKQNRGMSKNDEREKKSISAQTHLWNCRKTSLDHDDSAHISIEDEAMPNTDKPTRKKTIEIIIQ